MGRANAKESGTDLIDNKDENFDDVARVGLDKKEDGEKKKEEKTEMVGFFEMFRFADGLDKFLMLLGFIGAVAHGGIVPFWIALFGELIDAFGPETTADEFLDEIDRIALIMTYSAIGIFVGTFFQVMGFGVASQRQTKRIRHLYFRGLLRQEMGWYDKEKTAGLSERMAGDLPKVQEALGEQLGMFVQFSSLFIGGFVVGFVIGWKLSLVMLAIVPLLGIVGALMQKYISGSTEDQQKAYADAGHVANEAIRMVRTVFLFKTQKVENDRYAVHLKDSTNFAKKGGKGLGLTMGVSMCLLMFSYALLLWYGGRLVIDDEMTSGDVLSVFFSVLMGAMAIGQAAPTLMTFATGRGAAVAVFAIIDRVPVIDSLSEEGTKPDRLKGGIEFKKAQFEYPTRPEEPVLVDMNMSIKPNETVALVGASGCGKSTIMALMERFYDVTGGDIEIDGINIKDLNVQWLRSNIALVSQTPILFPTTIFENISGGKIGATKQDVIKAAKAAHAHRFVSEFPDGYDTLVGDQGAQLSGGQKQRIAIARALIHDPRILLLDEATSALDNESEQIVQGALEEASVNRTTIMIAHRLSTVMYSDRVFVMGTGGSILESGSPQELLDKKGLFYEMVNMQQGGEGGDLEIAARKSMDGGLETVVSTEGDEPEVAKKEKGEDEEENDEDDPTLVAVQGSLIRWAIGLNKPEWFYLILGCLCAMFSGLLWPVYAIILSELVGLLQDDPDMDEIRWWCLGFVGVGLAMLTAVYFKFAFLAEAGAMLTYRLRLKSFWSLLHRSAGWHDLPDHSKVLLTSRLSEDASAVKGVVGDRLGVTVESFTVLLAGLIVAFVYCWRVAVVVLATLPFVAVGSMLQMNLMKGGKWQKEFEKSTQLVGNVLDNIRTVVASGHVGTFLAEYDLALKTPVHRLKRVATLKGLAAAFGEASIFMAWSLAFWWGGRVVDDGYCDFTQMFTAIMAFLIGGAMSGQVQSFAPDAQKANRSARHMYQLIKQMEKDEAEFVEKSKPTIKGAVSLKEVTFRYPTRPDVEVLTGLNLEVPVGQTLALVGRSGCGKSTIISLIARLYEPESGELCFDGTSHDDIDTDHILDAVGVVSQEPELFSLSIKDNITYGLDDGEWKDEDVFTAAKEANAYDFVMEFDNKFDTMVGERGTQLSGGQRQRIAIARAMIRKEKIRVLLLDEASAALDSASEKLVHEALERARQGRTTILVAHRLSTVRNADSIAVVDEGKIVEQGTHDDLMAKRGFYYDLVSSQELQETTDQFFDERDANGAPTAADTVTANVTTKAANPVTSV